MGDRPGPSIWQSVTHFFALVCFEAPFCYAVLYWLLPKYLVEQRYIEFFVWMAILYILLNILLLTFIGWYYLNLSWEATVGQIGSVFVNQTMSGALPICLLLAAYKMIKIWYKKDEERALLTIGNTHAELLLLKAQVHPHFLFNTLNNIYSYTLDRSPVAGELLGKLSHILRYMTKECEASRVSVESELKMIQDYLELERVRYGPRLQLEVEMAGDTHRSLIAPLLMIPFVENSFKHGASKMLKHPWIKVGVTLKDQRLYFHVSNSRPPPAQITNRSGLGLKNVQRRLQLLYPGAHSLDIKSDDDSFSVDLMVEFDGGDDGISKDSFLPNGKSVVPF
ncbi:MAG TPA: histidine kinase [Chryseolinea sp.]|nr:histidine kinase [Chryseolinea sp.]